MKNEVADELGLSDKIRTIGWPNMASRECDRIGGSSEDVSAGIRKSGGSSTLSQDQQRGLRETGALGSILL